MQITLEELAGMLEEGSVVRCESVQESEAVYRLLEDAGYPLFEWEQEFLYEDTEQKKQDKFDMFHLPGLEEEEDVDTGEIYWCVTTFVDGVGKPEIPFSEISNLVSCDHVDPPALDISGVFESIYGGM